MLRDAPGGGWRRDGARGERRRRRVSRAPAADPQPKARAAGGQRDPVPQLHFALLLPRYAPPRACALRTCRLPPRARPRQPWNRTWGDGCPVLGTARILPLRVCVLILSSDSDLHTHPHTATHTEPPHTYTLIHTPLHSLTHTHSLLHTHPHTVTHTHTQTLIQSHTHHAPCPVLASLTSR